jgi:hypothetical protein
LGALMAERRRTPGGRASPRSISGEGPRL